VQAELGPGAELTGNSKFVVERLFIVELSGSGIGGNAPSIAPPTSSAMG